MWEACSHVAYQALSAPYRVLQLGDGVIGAGLGVGVVLLGLLGRLVGQDFGELGHLDCLQVCKADNSNLFQGIFKQVLKTFDATLNTLLAITRL